MRTTHTLVIGGGQAGLAMSRCLTDAGTDHVVLDRTASPSGGGASAGIRCDCSAPTGRHGCRDGPTRVPNRTGT